MESTSQRDEALTIGPCLLTRARSVAHRLLAGAGVAELVAFDFDPGSGCATLRHGLSRFGEFMVAGRVADDHPVGFEGPLRVRLDVVKDAPEFRVQITASSAHALGVLRWLPAEVADRYLADSLSPELVEAARLPGARLGIIEIDHVHLHDSTGTTAIPFDEIARHHERGCVHHRASDLAFPDAAAEWTVHELVSAATKGDPGVLFDHPRTIRLSTYPSNAGAVAADMTYCVDVDRFGITMIRVGQQTTSLALLQFESPVSSLNELENQLDWLICPDPTPERPLRI